MKTLRTSIIASGLLAIIALAACKKNGVSPSSSASGPQLSFQMKADNSTSLAASTSGLTTNSFTIPGLTFTSAVANISQFKLEATKNGVETEISTRNLPAVDLFALSPAIANASITPGTYTHVEIKVELKKVNDPFSIPLTVKGTFTNSSGQATPFELDLNDNVEIKGEAGNVTVTDTTNFSAIIHLHLPRLESGITANDLDNGTLTNGVLIISANSNTSIYRRILENLANSGEAELRHGHDDRGDDHGDDNGDHGNGGDDNGGSGNGNGGPGKG